MGEAQLNALADAIARHALAWLLIATLVLLAIAFVAWRAIERHAPRLVERIAPHWARLDRHRFAARYLGWHAAAAFVAVGLAAGGFAELAEHLGADQTLVAFDTTFTAALGRHIGPQLLQAMSIVTHLGDTSVLTGLVVTAAAVLLLRRRTTLAASFALAAAGGGLLIRTMKAVFERTRPERLHDLSPVHGYSFPSGHAAGSMLVYGLGAYLLIRHLPRTWHLPTGAVALLLIVTVGASRVLLQVHYASDVLAGWMLAASWGALCVAGYEGVRLSGLRRSPR